MWNLSDMPRLDNVKSTAFSPTVHGTERDRRTFSWGLNCDPSRCRPTLYRKGTARRFSQTLGILQPVACVRFLSGLFRATASACASSVAAVGTAAARKYCSPDEQWSALGCGLRLLCSRCFDH